MLCMSETAILRIVSAGSSRTCTGPPGATSPVYVLVGVFVIQTVGELCLSPVGLSATSSLAPKAFASQAMALWFLAVATGQSLAAQLIRAMEGLPDGQFFLTLGVMAVVVGVALAAISPWIHARMRDAEPDHDASAGGGMT